MGLINQRSLSDLRGGLLLATEATVGVTSLVEQMHHTIQLGHAPFGVSRADKTTGLTGLIYQGVRGTTKLVGRGLNAGLALAGGLLPEQDPSASRDAFVSVINGVYGDHLQASGNPLAIEMELRLAGQVINLGHAEVRFPRVDEIALSGKIMVFLHGLCLNESHWVRNGHNRAQALASDLGYTPLFLRYNSGLPIANNGHELAETLERLLSKWPLPVDELVIIGHSMGGLLARSACHQGAKVGHRWLHYLGKIFFLGSPHHGAPLERVGSWLDFAMDLSPYLAPFTRLGKQRSAGITDLRHGAICDEADGFVGLPEGVDCYAMAATLSKKRRRVNDKLIGDGLVPVDSALGRNKDPTRALLIPEHHQWIGLETGHMEMLDHPGLYQQLHKWLSS